MNTGMGDAMNLGWKLAAAVDGSAPPWLLDSYETERHPVGAAVLSTTDAFNQVVFGRSRLRRIARTIVIGTLTRIPRTRRMMRELLSGIGIAYQRKRGDHPLVGRRMPDIDCNGTRLYELLRDGKFVLVTAMPVRPAVPTSCMSSAGIRSFPRPCWFDPTAMWRGQPTGCPILPNWLLRWGVGVPR